MKRPALLAAVGMLLVLALWGWRQRLNPDEVMVLGGWFTGHDAPVTALSFGDHMLASGGGGQVLLWDLERGETVHRLPVTPGRWLGLTRDDGVLLAADARIARLWPTTSLVQHETAFDAAGAPEAPVGGCANTDAAWVAYRAGSGLIASHAMTGYARPQPVREPIGRPVFAADCVHLAVQTKDGVTVVHVPSAKRIAQLEVPTPLAFALGPQGRWLALAYTDHVRVRPVRTDDAGWRVEAFADAPADAPRLLALGAEQRLVAAAGDMLWVFGPKGSEPRRLSGHRGTIRSLALSTDGARVATGADDRTVRIWQTSEPTSP